MESFASLLVSEACHDIAAAALIEPQAAGGQWTILYSKNRPLNVQGTTWALSLNNAIYSADTEHGLQGEMYCPIEPQLVKKSHRRLEEAKKYINLSRTPVKLGEDSQLAFGHNIFRKRTLAEA